MKHKKRIIVFTSIVFLTLFLGFFSMNLFSNKTPYPTFPQGEKGQIKTAVFAGGCFWCMEGIFEGQQGVAQAISGYIGGTAETADYTAVSSGDTQHREAVQVQYYPEKISYETLVELYWTQIDPTDPEGQFADKGFHYTTAIYFANDDEKQIAENSKQTLTDSGKFEKPIVTSLLSLTDFYPAESYHQDYYKKSSLRYNLYKKGSGRADFIDENWKARIAEINTQTYSDEALKERLTPLQYEVTQEGATERAFQNEYWDSKEAGIYVDIIDGTPLYSSLDKYDSGTGWPSFTKPIVLENITTHEDNTLFSVRTEVKSASSDAHLGHVFDDGPKDAGGLRYCMNSAAMRFVPLADLEAQGYGEYTKLFESTN